MTYVDLIREPAQAEFLDESRRRSVLGVLMFFLWDQQWQLQPEYSRQHEEIQG